MVIDTAGEALAYELLVYDFQFPEREGNLFGNICKEKEMHTNGFWK
jgi:hypothetical protein